MIGFLNNGRQHIPLGPRSMEELMSANLKESLDVGSRPGNSISRVLNMTFYECGAKGVRLRPTIPTVGQFLPRLIRSL